MHDRYYARWPLNLLMVQHNIATPTQSDTVESVWLTAVVPPDRLRIDVVPRDLANGVLVLRDTQYVITNARPTQISRFIHRSASAARGLLHSRIRDDQAATRDWSERRSGGPGHLGPAPNVGFG
jgi:hypothetical protein